MALAKTIQGLLLGHLFFDFHDHIGSAVPVRCIKRVQPSLAREANSRCTYDSRPEHR